MKKSKSIRICLEDIIIGTHCEEEIFYPLNDNRYLVFNILEVAIEACLFSAIYVLTFFKRLFISCVKIIKFFL